MTTINILLSVLCAILSNIVAIASSSKSFPQNRFNADAEQYFSMKKEGSTIKIKFFYGNVLLWTIRVEKT